MISFKKSKCEAEMSCGPIVMRDGSSAVPYHVMYPSDLCCHVGCDACFIPTIRNAHSRQNTVTSGGMTSEIELADPGQRTPCILLLKLQVQDQACLPRYPACFTAAC